MQRFQDVETRTPVILTTSQLLTTALTRPPAVTSCWFAWSIRWSSSSRSSGAARACATTTAALFNILDYTGTATRNFADPAFDGDPAFATQRKLTNTGRQRPLNRTPEPPKMKKAKSMSQPGHNHR